MSRPAPDLPASDLPAADLPAADLVAALTARGETVACAESLTGGLVCAALTDVPGASAVVRGGVVSYATAVKASVLGVDAGLLDRGGAVQAEVAREMAEGVCRVLGSDWGVATTGVAGPEPQDGAAVGTVFVAVAGPGGAQAVQAHLSGERAQIRAGAVSEALRLLRSRIEAMEEPDRRGR